MDDEPEIYKCSDETTLVVICNQLKTMQNDIREIKGDQKEIKKDVNEINIALAKYPPPGVLQKIIDKVKAHDIYFGLMGFAITVIVGFLVVELHKLV